MRMDNLRDICVGIAIVLVAAYAVKTQVLLDRQRTVITQACLTGNTMAMKVGEKLVTFRCVEEKRWNMTKK